MELEILVLAYTVLAGAIVVAIGYDAGKRADAKERKIRYMKGEKRMSEVDKVMDESFYNRFVAPKIKAFSNMAENSQGMAKDGNKKVKEIENQLGLAGMHISVDTFIFYKQAFMILLVVITGLISLFTRQYLIVVIGGIIAIEAPTFYLGSKAKKNQQGIRDQLPDAFDLLGVCIESGLSFDASLLKVSEKMHGPFIDELLNLYRQIQMGVPRIDALKKMAAGTEIPELKTFLAALAQATQLGIPINNVMAVQSAQLRQTRMQMAKEKGNKAPVKILIPMLLLIFPVLFIILLAPTVMNIMEVF